MEDFEEEVIFDDDEFLDDGEIPTNEDVIEDKQEDVNDYDLTSEVLRLKGISDPNKIKFEDETGAIIERDWNSLSKSEQLNILSESVEDGLDSDEIELLNQIRTSGMSVSEFVNSLQTAQEQPVQEKRYDVEDLSDDDVYALDLMYKVEDISDAEIDSALEAAKQNPELFKKTVDGLRKEFIKLQEEKEVREANEQAAVRQQMYDNFSNAIIGEINNLNTFAGQELELSREDSENLASFMLDLDDNGVSAFGHALNDPALFTKAAFWLLNEEEIMSEINKQIQMNYQRGYEAGKKDSSRSSLVMNTQKKQTQVDNEEVFFDEEEW